MTPATRPATTFAAPPVHTGLNGEVVVGPATQLLCSAQVADVAAAETVVELVTDHVHAIVLVLAAPADVVQAQVELAEEDGSQSAQSPVVVAAFVVVEDAQLGSQSAQSPVLVVVALVVVVVEGSQSAQSPVVVVAVVVDGSQSAHSLVLEAGSEDQPVVLGSEGQSAVLEAVVGMAVDQAEGIGPMPQPLGKPKT